MFDNAEIYVHYNTFLFQLLGTNSYYIIYKSTFHLIFSHRKACRRALYVLLSTGLTSLRHQRCNTIYYCSCFREIKVLSWGEILSISTLISISDSTCKWHNVQNEFLLNGPAQLVGKISFDTERKMLEMCKYQVREASTLFTLGRSPPLPQFCFWSPAWAWTWAWVNLSMFKFSGKSTKSCLL